MFTINEIQLHLQNLLKRIVSQAELGKALGTGRSNINLRIKNKSKLKIDEIKKLEKYFCVSLSEYINNELNLEEMPLSFNDFYSKSLQILNSASEKELEFYYGLLKQGKKGIEILNS